MGIKINMQGRIYDPAIGRFISADPYVQYPLWSQGLNRYSYGNNNPMSGTDPSGFGWFNDAFGDSSGWELTAFVGGFGSIVAVGAFASGNGSAAAGASGGNEVGGALGLANAVAGLSDPGANQSFAEPMGELGSGAEFGQGSGLYNEGARAAPGQVGGDRRVACYEDFCGSWGSPELDREAREAALEGYTEGAVVAASYLLPEAAAVRLLELWRAWRAARVLRVAGEILTPGGVRIGQAGASASVRVLEGGEVAAQAVFEKLATLGTKFKGSYAGRAVSLPGGGFVGLRTVATSSGARAIPGATIDINIPGIAIRELKFLP